MNPFWKLRLALVGLLLPLLLVSMAKAQDFTVIALPDTQNEAQHFPQVLASQTQWIVNNRQALNIGVVLGEGDIVNDGADYAQQANADAAYKLLDNAGIPYFAAIGNHDYNGFNPKAARNVTGFNHWFGPARYAGHPFYLGNLNNSNENFYGVVTMGGQQYLVLVLEYMPRPASLAWGESILAANADKEAIIVTHSYMYVDNTRVDRCDTQDMPRGNATGDDMWAVFRKHANVIMVVSGHLTNGQVARRSDIADNGNLVNQILTNYQTFPNGGDGWLRIITFHRSANTISVQTYSPWLKQYKTDAANQYTVYYHNPHLGSGKGTLSGRVRDNNCKALLGIKVAAGGFSATTSANGSYSMTLPPGAYAVTASGAGWNTASQNESVADSFDTDLDFYMTTGGSPAPPPTPTPSPTPGPSPSPNPSPSPSPSPTPGCTPNSASPSVTICTPANGATVTSPVQVTAETTDSHPVSFIQAYVDGKPQVTQKGGTLNASLPMISGTHRLTVQAQDSAGVVFKQTINITVR